MARKQYFSKLDDAIALAEFAHRNQSDQAGMPYIEHPKRVLAAVQQQGAMPYVQIAAILHDVTEDTTYTVAMLRSLGFPEPAIDIVDLVDREASEKRFKALVDSGDFVLGAPGSPEYYKLARDNFYYQEIRKNPGALQVKYADIGDNTLPWRLNYLAEARQKYLRAKYAKALHVLNGAEHVDL